MHGRSNTGRSDNGGNRSGGGHHSHNRSAGQHSSSSNSGSNQRRNPRVHTFDSNGPDVRIRGNAYQINEKYVTLARDANSAGDRVLAESYLQHAEHYQRLINEMTEEFGQQHYSQPQQHQQSQQQPQQEQHSQHSQQVQPQSSQDYSQQPQPAQPSQQQQRHQHSQPQQHRRVAETVQPAVEDSETDGLNDLDQSFLVGPRRGLPPRETQQPVVAQRPRRQATAPVERPKSNGHAVEETSAEGHIEGNIETETAAAAPVRQPRPRYPRPQKEPDAV
jgi:hypothetical protein